MILGMILYNWILSRMGAGSREITFGAGFALGWFLMVVTMFSVLPFQGGKRTYSSERVTVMMVGVGAMTLSFAVAVVLPIGLWYTVRYGGWGLLPLLVTAQLIGFAALAGLLWQRPWRHREQSAHRPEVPKLLGIGHPDRMPSGWCPVVFHRPDVPIGVGVDFAVELDGQRVGLLAPGQTLIIGLPPGEHEAWSPGFPQGPRSSFRSVLGEIVHLTVQTAFFEGPSFQQWIEPMVRQEQSA
jgi:hypothetical protein